jgi:sRNA-binding protein
VKIKQQKGTPHMTVTKPVPKAVIAARQLRYRRMISVRLKLVEQFPKCFKGFGVPKLPLMIGIDRAVWQAAPSIGEWHDVVNAITDYVKGKTYLTAMVEGRARVDLEGNAVGVVTLRHQLHAQKQFRQIVAKEQMDKEKAAKALEPVQRKPKSNVLSKRFVVEVIQKRRQKVIAL